MTLSERIFWWFVWLGEMIRTAPPEEIIAAELALLFAVLVVFRVLRR